MAEVLPFSTDTQIIFFVFGVNYNSRLMILDIIDVLALGERRSNFEIVNKNTWNSS